MSHNQQAVSHRFPKYNSRQNRHAAKTAAIAFAAAAACQFIGGHAAYGQTTYTWTQTATGTYNWSTPGDWSANIPPVSSNTSVVDFFANETTGPAAGATINTSIDIANPLLLNILNLNGETTTSGPGAQITIGGDGLEFNGTSSALNLNAAYGQSTDAGTTYTITAPVDFNVNTAINFANNGGNLYLDGALSGAGTLTINDSATNRAVNIEYPGSTFTGNVNVASGELQIDAAHNALGSNGMTGGQSDNGGTLGSQTVTVSSNASFVIAANGGAYNVPQNFVINGNGTGQASELGQNAALVANGVNFSSVNIGALNVATNSTAEVDENIVAGSAPNYDPNWGMVVNGALSGSGNLTKIGSGFLYLTTTATSYSGNLNVNQGAVVTGGLMGFGGSYANTPTVGTAGTNEELGTNPNYTQDVTVNATGSFVMEMQYGGSANFTQNFILNGTGTGNIQAYDQSSPPNAYSPGESLGADAALQVFNNNYGGDFTLGTVTGGTYVGGGGLAIASNATIRVNTAENTGGNFGLLVYGPLAGTGNLSLVGNFDDKFDVNAYDGVGGFVVENNGFLELEHAAGAVAGYAAFTGNVNVGAGFVLSVGAVSDALGTNAGSTQTVTVANTGSFVLDEGQGGYTEPQNFVLNGTGTGTTAGEYPESLGTDAALQAYNIEYGDAEIGGLNIATASTIRVNTNTGAAAGLGLQVMGPLTGSATLTKIGSSYNNVNYPDEFQDGSGPAVPQNDGILEFESASATFTGNVIVNSGILATGAVNQALGANTAHTQTVTIDSTASMLFDEQGEGAYANPQNFILNGNGTGDPSTADYIAVGSDAALQVLEANYGVVTVGGVDIQTASTIRVNTVASPTGTNDGLQINGPLAGPGALTIVGATGDSIQSGDNNDTALGYGTVILTQAAGAVSGSTTGDGAFSGNVTLDIGSGGGTTSGPVLELAGVSDALGTNSGGSQTVTVNTGSAVVINGENGAFANPQLFVINGAGTGDPTAGALGATAALQATNINFSNATIGGLNVASASTVSVTSTVGFGLAVNTGLTGSGNLTVIGGGRLILTAAANSYTGSTVTVQGATLSATNSSGSATGSAAVTLTGGVLISGATGAFTGAISADATSTIAPGGIGSVGTLSLGGLTTVSGATLNFDLGTRTGLGEVTNGDLLNLGSGTSIASGTDITLGETPVASDDYRLMGGSISGIPLANFTLPSVAGETLSLSTTVDSGFIDLVAANATSTAVFWDNAGATSPDDGKTWDTTNHNWNNGSGATTYANGDAVTFNDTNNGNYSVTLSTTVSPASVTVNNSSGNYSITGTGKIVDTGAFTKSGTGSLTLDTALSAGSFSITGGTMALAANTTLGSGAATSNVNVSSMSITGTGQLDITNNHIIIDYGSSDPMSTIYSYLKSGYNNGAWNGLGIISSSARTLTNGLKYGIGFSDGNDRIAGHSIVTGLSSGQIELKYTLLGDANLDGTVNGSDFSILAANFGQGYSNWDQGNFEYTPAVNGTDFSALAANFGQGDSGAAASVSQADIQALDAFAAANGLPAPTIAAVPEPATIGLLTVGTMGVLSRRRRRRE